MNLPTGTPQSELARVHYALLVLATKDLQSTYRQLKTNEYSEDMTCTNTSSSNGKVHVFMHLTSS